MHTASDNLLFNSILTYHHLHSPFAMINISKIQSRMEELKLTKAQLSKNSGLTRVTIDKILSGGKINVETLEALATGLGVSVGFFFDDNIGGGGATQIGGSNNRIASHNYGCDPEEEARRSDKILQLEDELKALKELMASKDARIDELAASLERERKMNDFLMNKVLNNGN